MKITIRIHHVTTSNLESVNKACQILTDILQEYFDRHAPSITKKIKGRPCQWISQCVRREMNERDNLLRKLRD